MEQLNNLLNIYNNVDTLYQFIKSIGELKKNHPTNYKSTFIIVYPKSSSNVFFLIYFINT